MRFFRLTFTSSGLNTCMSSIRVKQRWPQLSIILIGFDIEQNSVQLHGRQGMQRSSAMLFGIIMEGGQDHDGTLEGSVEHIGLLNIIGDIIIGEVMGHIGGIMFMVFMFMAGVDGQQDIIIEVIESI